MEGFSPSASTPASTQRTAKRSQACDACRLRKVKCSGEARCRQCSHLDLRCVYSAPKPRQRAFKRGGLITQYKARHHENGGTAQLLSPWPTDDVPVDRGSPGDQLSLYDENSASQQCGSHHSERLPSLASLDLPVGLDGQQFNATATDQDFFLGFSEDYEQTVYPMNPVVPTSELQASIMDMGNSQEARTFVYATVAVTMILSIRSSQYDEEALLRINHWVDQAVNSKQVFSSASNISRRMVMTAEFIHMSFMGLQKQELGFYYLREATTLIQMMRMDDAAAIEGLTSFEIAARQRMYWEVFIHERYMAIVCYRSVVLPPLSTMPQYDEEISPEVHEGFTQIIRLFRLIDHDFVQAWLATRAGAAPAAAVTQEWIEAKQVEVEAEPAGNDDQVSDLPLMQQVDLIVSKHWIRTLVWQLALSNCVLTTTVAKQSMSLTFPLGLSSSLRTLITGMSRRDVEVHGSGIQQKLFELTDTIANVLLARPDTDPQEAAHYADDFVFLAKFIWSLPTFEPVQRKILQDKLWELQGLSFARNESFDRSAVFDGG